MAITTSTHHLTSQEYKAITALLTQIHKVYPGHIIQTILFGSKARGDSHTGSDIDLLILVKEEDWALRQTINTLAARVSLEYDVLIGPRVIGEERWEQMKQQNFSFYHNVSAEGVPLSALNR